MNQYSISDAGFVRETEAHEIVEHTKSEFPWVDGLALERRLIVEDQRIHRCPRPRAFAEHRGRVDAAAPADEEVGGSEAPAVSRVIAGIPDLDSHAARRIGRGARAVPPAKRAIAGAQRQRARIDARVESDRDVAAMASPRHRCPLYRAM